MLKGVCGVLVCLSLIGCDKGQSDATRFVAVLQYLQPRLSATEQREQQDVEALGRWSGRYMILGPYASRTDPFQLIEEFSTAFRQSAAELGEYRSDLQRLEVNAADLQATRADLVSVLGSKIDASTRIVGLLDEAAERLRVTGVSGLNHPRAIAEINTTLGSYRPRTAADAFAQAVRTLRTTHEITDDALTKIGDVAQLLEDRRKRDSVTSEKAGAAAANEPSADTAAPAMAPAPAFADTGMPMSAGPAAAINTAVPDMRPAPSPSVVDDLEACSGTVDLRITPGTSPVFSWEPNCALSYIEVKDSRGVSLWWVSHDGGNSLRPGIVYGQSFSGAPMLQKNAEYTVIAAYFPPGWSVRAQAGIMTFKP